MVYCSMINDWKITLWDALGGKTLTLTHMHQMTEVAARATALADWPRWKILECIPEDAESDIHPSWY